MAARIRLGLLFGNRLVREGRRMLLETQPEFDIVWEGSDGLEAIESLGSAVLDVVLVDNRLSSLSGIETIRRFLRRNQDNGSAIPAFILTGPFQSAQMSIEAIRCGATDLVTEEDTVEALFDALRNATNPDKQVDSVALQRFFEAQGIAAGSNTRWLLRLTNLTPEEELVLAALKRGVEFSGLRQETGLPATKLRWVLAALQARWNFVSRAQLVLALHEAGLLTPNEPATEMQ